MDGKSSNPLNACVFLKFNCQLKMTGSSDDSEFENFSSNYKQICRRMRMK